MKALFSQFWCQGHIKTFEKWFVAMQLTLKKCYKKKAKSKVHNFIKWLLLM